MPLSHVALDVSFLLDAAEDGALESARRLLGTYVRLNQATGVTTRAVTGGLQMLRQPEQALAILRTLSEYNRQFPTTRLTQLEYDIEPHTTGDGWQRMIAQWLRLLTELRVPGMEVGATIPYWYRHVKIEDSDLAWAVSARVDFVVTMAYRSSVALIGAERLAAARMAQATGTRYAIAVDYRGTEPGTYLSTPQELLDAAAAGGITVNSNFTLLA